MTNGIRYEALWIKIPRSARSECLIIIGLLTLAQMDQIWQCWVVLLLFNLKTGCDSSCGDDGEFYVRDFIATVILIPG